MRKEQIKVGETYRVQGYGQRIKVVAEGEPEKMLGYRKNRYAVPVSFPLFPNSAQRKIATSEFLHLWDEQDDNLLNIIEERAAEREAYQKLFESVGIEVSVSMTSDTRVVISTNREGSDKLAEILMLTIHEKRTAASEG